MPPLPIEWGNAFARQARADLLAWEILLNADHSLPSCQHLHFLQMPCEKLVKAHLCHSGSDPDDIQTSHAYIRKTLPIVLHDECRRSMNHRKIRALEATFRKFCAEIEYLSPSNTGDGSRLDNCEYPWLTGEKIRIPAEHSFWADELLKEPNGRTIIKTIRSAIDDFINDI